MRPLWILLLAMTPVVCSADWSADFYRYQCVPELGRIYIDTFSVENPDQYGSIGTMESGESAIAALAKVHEIYEVAGEGREHACSLGDNMLRILFTFGRNSQGQYFGRITIQSGTEKLISDLSLFAYYGYEPLVTRIEIVSRSWFKNLGAYFDVIGAKGHPSFGFSSELTAGNPITNSTVFEESRKHP